MTPGKEEETLLKRSMYAMIVTATPSEKAFKLKDKCDAVGMHTYLMAMHVPQLNPVNFAR